MAAYVQIIHIDPRSYMAGGRPHLSQYTCWSVLIYSSEYQEVPPCVLEERITGDVGMYPEGWMKAVILFMDSRVAMK